MTVNLNVIERQVITESVGRPGPQGEPGTLPQSIYNRGFLYVNGNTQFTQITTQDTFTIATPQSEVLTGFNVGFDHNGNSRLTYIGDEPSWFWAEANACIQLDSNNIEVRMRVAKNGQDLNSSCSHTYITGLGSGDRKVDMFSTTPVYLEQGDYIETAIGNWTNTDNILVRNMGISLKVAVSGNQ